MKDFIVIFILIVVLGGAALYVYRAKKRGEKCIGCPYAKSCGGAKCDCNSSKEKK